MALLERDAVAALLAAGAGPDAAPDALRLSPGHLAARTCDTDTLALLRAQGGSLLQADAFGRTAEDILAASAAWCGAARPAAPVDDCQQANARQYDAEDAPSGWRAPPDRSGTADAVPLCHSVLPTVPMGADFTREWFVREALTRARPLVVLNATGQWPLRQAVTRAALLAAHSDTDVLVSKIPYGEHFGVRAGVASLAEFVRYMDQVAAEPESEPLYIFGWLTRALAS